VLTKGVGELQLRESGVYRDEGGYAQRERAVREMQPADVIDATVKSNLRGRGGA